MRSERDCGCTRADQLLSYRAADHKITKLPARPRLFPSLRFESSRATDTTIYTYGDDVTVTWDRARCIHAAACVEGLPSVFDPEQRPWIDPAQAMPNEVEPVVPRCPTGALDLTRSGTDPEPTPDANRIRIAPNGPLYVHGDIELVGADGATLLSDTRMALRSLRSLRTQALLRRQPHRHRLHVGLVRRLRASLLLRKDCVFLPLSC